jgi:DNA polymerase III subunit gamma/tau
MSNLAISTRPRTLDKVFNQAGVINEIKTRAKKNDWPNAMLLKGVSGTGKSTVAQIVAMTINCSALKENGDPCCECASCKSIMEERFDRDTLVLDGSTLGVKDDVISFGQLADMSPMYDKKRILIIEESDQLSTSAKNALHKILEKPRNHVHFILLSMVSSGLPPSIQSRCQTYNFKPFALKEVALGLKKTMEDMDIWQDTSIPDSFKLEGLMTIASASKGSFREALQYLEKCLTGQYYTKEDIRNNLGIIDDSTVNELLSKLLASDKSFFELFNSVDFNEFFNLGYYTLSSAYAYLVSGFTENEWFEETIKGISKHPRLRESLLLFDDLYKESKPYIKKSYMISRIAQFFTKNGSISSTTQPQQDTSSFKTRQALLDAEAQARSFTTTNNPVAVHMHEKNVETTNLSRPVRIPRG